MGELSRMTQFKDKSAVSREQRQRRPVRLSGADGPTFCFIRPIQVPVGNDQKQHLELTRDICTRFNNLYGEVFTLPEPFIPTERAQVMSLQDPTKKMSKSDDNEANFIGLLEDPKQIVKKIKRAMTDSTSRPWVRFDPENKPGFQSADPDVRCDRPLHPGVEQHFEGKMYGHLKSENGRCRGRLAGTHPGALPRAACQDEAHLQAILAAGAQKARGKG